MKTALFVYGGWEGHEPRKCVDIFVPYLQEHGFKVEVSDTLDSFLDEPGLKSLSLIIPAWTMGNLSEKQESGLLEAVKSGVGIAGWHGGMGDAFRNNYGYRFMVGGIFMDHPGGIHEYEVNIIKGDDPIIAGIKDFKMTSEQYYMHVDPSNEVLATTIFAGAASSYGSVNISKCIMPVVWKRAHGLGRVFYCSLGHVAKDFEIPEVRTITQRGLLWASR